MDATFTRLYPAPPVERPIKGAYLAHDVRALASLDRPFIYANFVSSLDGRTSQIDRESGRIRPPRAISSEDDWRLYRELAAQADAVVTSSSRLTAMLAEGRDEIECVEGLAEGDVGAWRSERGLPPQPSCIVLGKTFDFPVESLLAKRRCDLVLMMGALADRRLAAQLRDSGIDVRFGDHRWVLAGDVVAMARARGFRTLYLIGGPDVLYTMLDAALLDRLYLTQALVTIGGRDYDTLVRGDLLMPPPDFRLHELHLRAATDDAPEILFASYGARLGGRRPETRR